MATSLSLLEELNEFISPYAPGVPEALINQQLWKAAENFCVRSQLWVSNVTLNIEKDLQQYYFIDQILDTDAKWNSVFDVVKSNENAELASETTRNGSAIKYINGTDYVMIRDDEDIFFVLLLSKPNKDLMNALHIRSVLKPDRKQMRMPKFILDDFAYEIAAGCLSFLQKQPRKPWTDLQSAVENNRIYISGINQARIKANRNYSNKAFIQTFPIAPAYNRKGITGLNAGGDFSVNG